MVNVGLIIEECQRIGVTLALVMRHVPVAAVAHADAEYVFAVIQLPEFVFQAIDGDMDSGSLRIAVPSGS